MLEPAYLFPSQTDDQVAIGPTERTAKTGESIAYRGRRSARDRTVSVVRQAVRIYYAMRAARSNTIGGNARGHGVHHAD